MKRIFSIPQPFFRLMPFAPSAVLLTQNRSWGQSTLLLFFFFTLLGTSPALLSGTPNATSQKSDTTVSDDRNDRGRLERTAVTEPPVPFSQVNRILSVSAPVDDSQTSAAPPPLSQNESPSRLPTKSPENPSSDSGTAIPAHPSSDSIVSSSANPQPADTQTANPQPADTQTANSQPADTQTANSQPADTLPADATSSDVPPFGIPSSDTLSSAPFPSDTKAPAETVVVPQPATAFDAVVVPREPSENLPRVVQRIVYDNSVTFFELSNGLKLFVHPRPNTSAATVQCYIRNTGPFFEEGAWGTGISFLVEQLVAHGGTSHHSGQEIQALRRQLGGIFQSRTEPDFTVFSLDCPLEKVPLALNLLTDQIQNALFDTNLFLTQSLLIRQQHEKTQSDRHQLRQDLLRQTVYQKSPARYSVLGYPELSSRLTLDQARTFYTTHYTPNNQILFVAGAVDPHQILFEVVQQYAGSERHSELCFSTIQEPAQISPRESLQEIEGETADLTLAWSTVDQTDSQAIALDVLSVILTKGMSARLKQRFQTSQLSPLFLDADAFFPALGRGSFAISTTALPTELPLVEKEILNEIQLLQTQPVSTEELNRAKKQLETSYVFASESFSVSVERLIRNYLRTGDPNFDRQYIAKIRSITPEELQKTVQNLFKDSTRSRILLMPPDHSPKLVPVDPPKPDGDILAYRFPENHLKVLVQQTSNVPLVNIQFVALGSTLLDTNQTAGRTALLAEMIGRGSSLYTSAQIAAYFDSIGTRLNVRAGRNTLMVSVTVLKEDFDKTIRLLSDVVFNPTFPENELAAAKKLQLTKIQQQNDDPVLEIQNTFETLLPPSTPYHFPLNGTPQNIENLTKNDLKDYHQTLFSPSNMIVSVFGDIDSNQTLPLLHDLLSPIPTPPQTEKISFDRTNTLLEPIDKHLPTQRENAYAYLAYPTVRVNQEKELAAILVLQTLLDRGINSEGKLFELFANQNLVLRLSVEQFSGPTPGYFTILLETKPSDLESVLQKVDAFLTQIKQGDLTEEEIEMTKDHLIARHQIQTLTLEERSKKMVLDELYGLGYQNDQAFEERIRQVTRDDVLSVANKFLNLRVTVTSSPYQRRK